MFEPRQLKIDLAHLPEQWQEQADWMQDACRDVAEAKAKLREANRLFELTVAKLSLRIREKPKEFGLEKATEKSVEAKVIVQTKYQDAQKAIDQAKYDVDIREALVTALVDRRKGLEDEVVLSNMGWFAAPSDNPTRNKVKA